MENPIQEDVRFLLQDAAGGSLSEIEVLRKLKDHPHFQKLGTGKLALFQKHFLITNAFYALQDRFFREGLSLEISPLGARLLPASPAKKGKAIRPHTDPGRRAWYLDWGNYESATEESIQELLKNFWAIYHRRTNHAEALRLFGLPEDATQEEVRKRYRMLVLRHHPDQGGDREELERIHSAWLMLRPGR